MPDELSCEGMKWTNFLHLRYPNLRRDFPYVARLNEIHIGVDLTVWGWIRDHFGEEASETGSGEFANGHWMYEGPRYRFARQKDAALFLLFWG